MSYGGRLMLIGILILMIWPWIALTMLVAGLMGVI